METRRPPRKNLAHAVPTCVGAAAAVAVVVVEVIPGARGLLWWRLAGMLGWSGKGEDGRASRGEKR